jgi:hypothetical protein
MLTRRILLATSALAALAGRIRTPAATTQQQAELRWHDVRDWPVEGRGWSDTERTFDRLPARAQGVVPAKVWDLSRYSAGMYVEFESDAKELWVRYELLKGELAMAHMPATGVSGLDLYARDGGRWRWVAVFAPGEKRCEGALVRGLDAGTRAYRLYLPLYNGVESLEIGVAEGERLTPLARGAERPVVFYGTSIVHGACASRPGMAWPSIVSRSLGIRSVNLGFSGNGRMELEMGDLLAEIDASAYVVDCLPNMSASMVEERVVPFVVRLRERRPITPVVLIEDRRYGAAWANGTLRARNSENADALRAAYARLGERGIKGLWYVGAETLLGEVAEESMTDGSHPSDLGMILYARAVGPVLAAALAGKVEP